MRQRVSEPVSKRIEDVDGVLELGIIAGRFCP